jgi:phage FluMu protein Com
METVVPDSASGVSISLASIFGLGPKWTITCGKCHATFAKRIPMVNHPGIACPNCHTVNILPIKIKRMAIDEAKQLSLND